MKMRSGSLDAMPDLKAGLDSAALLRSAQFVAGSFGPVDPGVSRRFSSFVDWFNGQAAPAPDQLRGVERQLRKLVATRLRLASDRERIPEIAEESIERPIFVIGFARTGTTLIHSLLAEDASARAPLWWQTHEPSPPPGEVQVTPQRIELAAQELDEMLRVAPGLLTLHPYWDKRGFCPIECEEIFTLDFQNAYPSLLYRVPALAMILDATNVGEAYRFHRSFLQHLQWNTQPRRWVLKGIYHQFVLKELFETYPDALCIWPHRDPVEVHPSTLAITAVLYGGITDWQMDFASLGPDFVKSIASSVEEAMTSPLIDDPRIVHVDFRELTRDPIATIQRAYRHWGLCFPPETETRMRAWLADPSNASDRYGRYSYAMEPFGLTREMIENAFEGYSRRFNLGRFA